MRDGFSFSESQFLDYKKGMRELEQWLVEIFLESYIDNRANSGRRLLLHRRAEPLKNSISVISFFDQNLYFIAASHSRGADHVVGSNIHQQI